MKYLKSLFISEHIQKLGGSKCLRNTENNTLIWMRNDDLTFQIRKDF